MAGLRLRRQPAPPDALVLARGGDLTVAELATDARRSYRRFGEYGVSVLAAADQTALDELARGVLRRFEVLTLVTAGSLRDAGLELRPTFRRPHYTIMLPDLDADLQRLVECENVRWANPYVQLPEA